MNLYANILNRDGQIMNEVMLIRDIDPDTGEEIQRQITGELTVKRAIQNALLKDSMQGITPENIMAKYNIFVRLQQLPIDEQIIFSEEELTVIKNAIAEKYPVLYAGQIINNL